MYKVNESMTEDMQAVNFSVVIFNLLTMLQHSRHLLLGLKGPSWYFGSVLFVVFIFLDAVVQRMRYA